MADRQSRTFLISESHYRSRGWLKSLNNNFNTLFTINEMTEMFKKLYRDTGLRFYMWYRKNFNMFIQKLNRTEVERLIGNPGEAKVKEFLDKNL